MIRCRPSAPHFRRAAVHRSSFTISARAGARSTGWSVALRFREHHPKGVHAIRFRGWMKYVTKPSEGLADRRFQSARTRTRSLQIDALVAGGQLSVRRADLPAGQSPAAHATGPRRRQAATARPLGHHAGAELHLRAPQPGDQGARPVDDLCHRARPRRARSGGQRLPRRHLHARSIPTSPRTPRVCGGCSGSSPSPAGSRRTSRRRPPVRSTRAASSGTRSRMPTARPSTTPTCWSRPWSATVRPRPVPWRRAGIPTSSLNPAKDGVVLPILHLNGYKIANPTVLARIPEDELRSLMVGYGHNPYFFEVPDDDPATTTPTRIAGSPNCSTPSSTKSPRSRPMPAAAGDDAIARAGR